MMISLVQHFEADFLWNLVSLKILNSGILLKTFTHAFVKNGGKRARLMGIAIAKGI